MTREGNHLFTQVTGQQKVEVFLESDHDFFLTVIDAQITFQTDSQGKVTGLVLHQGGDHPAAGPNKLADTLEPDPKIVAPAAADLNKVCSQRGEQIGRTWNAHSTDCIVPRVDGQQLFQLAISCHSRSRHALTYCGGWSKRR